ncbi:uncharacterized protein LOC134221976 [Armigeres subalbatus]|uniref:uncharacterized protein LOC134221976 n=1 Tax=Armigeres subalbatus TaxID=124917 RepID=UPI002ED5EB4F
MDDEATEAFKDLYREIDKLYYPSVNAPISRIGICGDSVHDKSEFVFRDEDVDDLIAYSKKFVEKTKNEIGLSEIVHSHEHGVQCVRSEKKSNKKVNTPPKWIGGNKTKESAGANCATAIQIIKKVPKMQTKLVTLNSSKPSEKNQLNNQPPSAEMKKVRNVGVNINFIKQKTVNRTNNNALIAEPNSSRTPPIIKKPATPKTSGKIYRFYSSKLSPSQLWEQQHPELSYESSERSIFPKRIKKSDIIAEQKRPAEISHSKELKIVHLSEGLSSCTINENAEPPAQPVEEQRNDQNEEETVNKPTITKHVIPVLSIKGDWKASLQVQETCRINISDATRSVDGQRKPNNLMYLEVKHGSMQLSKQTQSPPDDEKMDNTKVDSKDAHKTHEPTTVIEEYEPIDSNVNRYLQPFLNIPKPLTNPSKKRFHEILVSSSDNSLDGIILESDSSDSDTANDLQSLLILQSTKKPIGKGKQVKNVCSKKYDEELPQRLNEAVAKKSIKLQVPSPPCMLISPPKTPPTKSVVDDDPTIDTCADMTGPSKFIENLRIWKSAIQVQSENMKLGNQLTENLDILKQNMEVIAGETQNITQITRNCEQNLKQIETLKERFTKKMDGTVFKRSPPDHLDHLKPLSNAGTTTECSFFGCHPELDTFDREPSFDQKAFQRAVLEQNPRYSKTIQKICEDGRNRSFKKAPTSPRGVAERAAQKFLQSCSRSVSRFSDSNVAPLMGSFSMRSHSPGSVASWDGSSGSESAGSTDGNVSPSSSWMIGDTRQSDGYSSSASMKAYDLSREICSISDKSSDGFTRIRKSLSDEGEVLSQGEIR